MRWDVLENPEDSAGLVTLTLWDGELLPVDPVRVAGGLHVRVFRSDLSEGVLAQVSISSEGASIIRLDRAAPDSTLRWVCARALGVVLSKGLGEEALVDLSWVSPLEPSGPLDHSLDLFAAELLMPRSCVPALRLFRPERVARLVGVPPEVASWRLAATSLVSSVPLGSQRELQSAPSQ